MRANSQNPPKNLCMIMYIGSLSKQGNDTRVNKTNHYKKYRHPPKIPSPLFLNEEIGGLNFMGTGPIEDAKCTTAVNYESKFVPLEAFQASNPHKNHLNFILVYIPFINPQGHKRKANPLKTKGLLFASAGHHLG